MALATSRTTAKNVFRYIEIPPVGVAVETGYSLQSMGQMLVLISRCDARQSGVFMGIASFKRVMLFPFSQSPTSQKSQAIGL